MTQQVCLVAGAPGAGKSTTVRALLALESAFVFFDIDWLVAPASALYGQDVRFAPRSWKPYGELWFGVLHAVVQNGLIPVLFTPNEPNDYEQETLPSWCGGLEWLLLDCADDVRSRRLQPRGWSEAQLKEALQDAAVLREMIARPIDTGKLSPDEVAEQVLMWLNEKLKPQGDAPATAQP